MSTTQTVPMISNPVIPKPLPKKSTYVHPFIELVNRSASETEIIGTIGAFICCREIEKDSNDKPIYEEIDQTTFITPMTQVFAYAANNGKTQLTKWIMDNFVPLQVSYDNNFCYFESLKWQHSHIADMIAYHESFVPTINILENLISRNKYDVFKHCMKSPYLKSDLHKYRFTFRKYIDDGNYECVKNLLANIKKKEQGTMIDIWDPICPNPFLVPTVQPVETIVPIDTTEFTGQLMEITESIELSVQPTAQSIQSVQSVQSGQSIEAVQSGQSIEAVQSVQSVQSVEPAISQTEPMDFVNPIHPIHPIDQIHSETFPVSDTSN